MSLKDTATSLAQKALGKAQEAKVKAEPYAQKAKEKAGGLAEQATPHVQMAVKKAGALLDQAGDKIAVGVSTIADKVDPKKTAAEAEPTEGDLAVEPLTEDELTADPVVVAEPVVIADPYVVAEPDVSATEAEDAHVEETFDAESPAEERTYEERPHEE